MLNKQQQFACTSNAKHILCLAGAGTGKTYTMLSRVERLVQEGADPASILVLTFTNASAFNMRNRFHENNKCMDIVPEFRTFHAFCYSLIAQNFKIRQALGYKSIPQIIDEITLNSVKASTRLVTGVKLSDKKLNSDGSKLSAKDKFEYITYHKMLSQTLHDSGHITFDMLCYDVCKLFESNDSIIIQYKKQYKYIFVDEFQDTDPRQWQFVNSFTESSIFLVGDALQSIYGFRGSDCSIIKAISADSNWQVIKLCENYRSSAQICDFANGNTKYADDNYRIAIQSNRQGSTVNVIELKRPMYYTQNFMDLEYTEILKFADQFNENSAILCRTNAEVSKITQLFTSKNILWYTNKYDEHMLHLFRSAIDDEYLLNWLKSELTEQDLSNYLRQRFLQPVDIPELEYFETIFKYNYRISALFKQVFDTREILYDNNISNTKKLQKLAYPISVAISDTDTLEEFCHKVVTGLTAITQSGIYVGTIHSAKGLEWNSVLVTGVDGPHFSLNSEEQNNLYYVGITRARNNLVVIRWVN